MNVRIKEIMAERGVRNIDLANRMGVKPMSLNAALSNGVSGVTNIVKIATALGVPVWQMFIEPEVNSNEMVSGQTEANRIADIMREKHITQRDLAERMGKAQATLCRIIGKTSINLQSLEAIAAALEVPVWQLFISEEDYRREMERRRGVTPVDNGEGIMDNKAPRDAATSEGMTTMATSAATHGKAFPEDLFAGAEEQEWPTLEDGTYRYGGVVIELRNGKINIAIPEK